jgi:hypothetical protein
MPTFSEAEVLNFIGGAPREIDEELKRFSRSARVLSSDQPRLIDQFPKQWVAVFDGQVVAHAPELGRVLRDLEEKNIAKTQTIIRFIDRDDHALIL